MEALEYLALLDLHLDYEIEEMDCLEALENEDDDDDDDDDDDYDPISDDDGYVSTDEVDFEARDFWVFGLNPVLGRIEL